MASSPTTRRRIASRLRRLDAVARHGRRWARPVVRGLADDLRGALTGAEGWPSVRRWLGEMTVPLAESQTMAYLYGVRDVITAARDATGARLRFAASFEDLASRAANAMHLPPNLVGGMVHRFETLGLAHPGMDIGAIAAELDQAFRTAIAEVIRTGETTPRAIAILNQKLRSLGLVGVRPWLIETWLRTGIAQAYAGGRWAAAQDPDIQSILWGFEYVTAGDDRVRPDHAGYDGVKLPKDHPDWLSIWPPNGWNCRCQTIEIFDAPAGWSVPKAIEVDGRMVAPAVEPKFLAPPGTGMPRLPWLEPAA